MGARTVLPALLAFAAFFFAAGPAVSAHATSGRTRGGAVRILSLGDSTTQGRSALESYRYHLWLALTDAGVEADLVGSLTLFFDGTSTCPDPHFDLDHEGHYGERADEILAELPGALEGYDADVALVLAGINDVYLGESSQSTIDDLGGMIDALRADNPGVVILLGKVPPTAHDQHTPAVIELNGMIDAFAAERHTDASPVIVVDHYADFDPEVDTFDGIHPSRSGAEKMAANWFPALRDVLEANTPPAGGDSAGCVAGRHTSRDAASVAGLLVVLAIGIAAAGAGRLS